MSQSSDVWQPRSMPAMLIARAAHLLARKADARFRELGVSVGQMPVFFALKDGGRLPQKELARLAGVEQPSMAQTLTRMERDGLIRRESNPDDRRSSFISLTDGALNRIGPGRAILAQGNREALAGFRGDEVDKLVELLHRVIANIGDAHANCPPTPEDISRPSADG